MILSNNRRHSASITNSQRPKSSYSINSATLERSESLCSNVASSRPQLLSTTDSFRATTNTISENDKVDNDSNNTSINSNKGNSDQSSCENECGNNLSLKSGEFAVQSLSSEASYNNIQNLTSLQYTTPRFLQNSQPYIPIKTNNEATSLLNKLKPTRQSSITSTTAHKPAKLPVTTDITKHMLSTTDSSTSHETIQIESHLIRRNSEKDNSLESPKPLLLNPGNKMLNSNVHITVESSAFEFPSPPAELLESTHEQIAPSPTSPLPSPPPTLAFIVTSPSVQQPASPTSPTAPNKPIPPPIIAPKPNLNLSTLSRTKSQIERNNVYNQRESEQFNVDQRKSLTNSSNSNRTSINLMVNNQHAGVNNNNGNSLILDELSSKLARQRMLIENASNNNNNGGDNTTKITTNETNNSKSSPKIVKKPPPPPRSDSTRLTNFINNNRN